MGADIWHDLRESSERHKACAWFKGFVLQNISVEDEKCQHCRRKVVLRIGPNMLLINPGIAIEEGFAEPIVQGCTRHWWHDVGLCTERIEDLA